MSEIYLTCSIDRCQCVIFTPEPVYLNFCVSCGGYKLTPKATKDSGENRASGIALRKRTYRVDSASRKK
jgi:hypothetical protein